VDDASHWLLGRMVELFAAGPPLLPGAAALLEVLAGAGIRTALVSSSYRVLVDAVLALGIGPFAVSLAGDEVTFGKPHPEPYLTAARLLGVDATKCVALEVVAVPSVPGVAFERRPRRLVLTSLTELDVAALAELIEPALPTR
jgi:beta-phosphoglucomutase-like phosphatase (HAD superfamily)